MNNKQIIEEKQEEKLAENDHRRLGKELELFMISEEAGQGFPIWLPKGAAIRRELERYIVNEELKRGYQHVNSPDIGKLELFKRSGHWAHYRENMFEPINADGEELILRPMSCAHHIQVFKFRQRSYRELPLRIAEVEGLYRYELSGVLSGLMRVRAFHLNDAHLFCREEQVAEEFKKVLSFVQKVYKVLGLKDYWYRFSRYDPKDKKHYVNKPEMWKKAEDMLEKVLKELGIPYVESIGDAAFYGPKLDIQVPSALGKDETVSTIQIDLHLPEVFDVNYIGEDGKSHRPVILHRAIISSLERFVAFLIEQRKGAFSLWLSPIQVKVISIADRHNERSKELQEQLLAKGIRAEVDDRSESMQKKIREAQLEKAYFMAVIGDKEVENNSVSVRKRSGEDLGSMSVVDFIKLISEQIESKKIE